MPGISTKNVRLRNQSSSHLAGLIQKVETISRHCFLSLTGKQSKRRGGKWKRYKIVVIVNKACEQLLMFQLRWVPAEGCVCVFLNFLLPCDFMLVSNWHGAAPWWVSTFYVILHSIWLNYSTCQSLTLLAVYARDRNCQSNEWMQMEDSDNNINGNNSIMTLWRIIPGQGVCWEHRRLVVSSSHWYSTLRSPVKRSSMQRS